MPLAAWMTCRSVKVLLMVRGTYRFLKQTCFHPVFFRDVPAYSGMNMPSLFLHKLQQFHSEKKWPLEALVCRPVYHTFSMGSRTSPIENVWHIMKSKKLRRPRTVQQLKMFIRQEWERIPLLLLLQLVSSIPCCLLSVRRKKWCNKVANRFLSQFSLKEVSGIKFRMCLYFQ